MLPVVESGCLIENHSGCSNTVTAQDNGVKCPENNKCFSEPQALMEGPALFIRKRLSEYRQIF